MPEFMDNTPGCLWIDSGGRGFQKGKGILSRNTRLLWNSLTFYSILPLHIGPPCLCFPSPLLADCETDGDCLEAAGRPRCRCLWVTWPSLWSRGTPIPGGRRRCGPPGEGGECGTTADCGQGSARVCKEQGGGSRWEPSLPPSLHPRGASRHRSARWGATHTR